MSKNKEIAKQIISSVQKHPRYKIDLYASIGNVKRTHIDAVLSELEAKGIIKINRSCDLVQPTEKTADAIIALDTEKSPDPVPSQKPAVIEPPKYAGLVIPDHSVRDAASKKHAASTLQNWQFKSLPLREWIAHLEAGHTIQPSAFAPLPDGTFTHAKEYWQATYIIAADADNIKDVEFLQDGTDKNPEGVDSFTSPTGLSEIYPKLKDKVYAAGQSVSSMNDAKPPPHRRYRLIFCFDAPITSPAHYHTILLALAKEYPIIPPAERSPAQPVFGNARKGFNRFAIPGNILRLSDYPIPAPIDTKEKHETRDFSQRHGDTTTLDGFLTKHQIAFTPDEKTEGKFFIHCPYTEYHTGAICKLKDSYVFVNTEGKFAYHCSHTSCKTAGRTTWQGFKDGYNIKNTETPQRHATARLSCTSRKTQQTEDMQTIRLMLNNGVKQWMQETNKATGKHILNLTTGTGTGKTTAALTNIDAFIDISPTKELADEKYQKALEIKIDALRHKPRFYNHAAMKEYHPRDMKLGLEGDDTVPCVYPEICTRLYLKGHSPRHVFCEKRCERRDDCQSKGYLSQFPTYSKVDAVFFSFDDDIFSDPNYKAIIEKTGKDLMILDEADPTKLPIERFLNIHEAKQAYKDYEHFTAGKFLKKLLEKLSLASTGAEFVTQAKETLAQFTDDEIENIEQEFGGIPVRVQLRKTNAFNDFNTTAEIKYRDTLRKCAVIAEEQIEGFKTPPELHGYVPDSIYPIHTDNKKAPYNSLLQLNTAARLGFIPLHSATHIDAIPRNLTNLPRDLAEFIDSVTETETPPVHPIANGWEFYLNAQINTKRGVLISASSSSDLLKAVYAHADIKIKTIDSMPPAWKDGNKCFQIATGRYTPAQSLIAEDTDNGSLSLKPRAREMLEIINRELQDGKETLIVTPKDFTSKGTLQHDPLIAKMLSQPHAHVINHHHAEGVNSFDSCQRAFIFHYEPRPDKIEKQACRIYRDKTLDFTRETTDFEKSSTVLHDVIRYRDPRVQAVFDRECEKRIYQALSRVRPELYNNKTIYLLTSEPIAIPVKTILFSLPDIQKCIETHGTLTNFEDFLTQQHARSVTEIAREDNVTERTAYRRTETPRKETKKSRDAEIIILHAEGHSERKIAMHCKVSQGCIQAVLKKHQAPVT